MFEINDIPIRYAENGSNIEVIAYFKNGEIKPLRLRIETERGRQVIKLKNVIKKWNDSVSVLFICEFILNNVKHTWQIRYWIKDMKWIIFNSD